MSAFLTGVKLPTDPFLEIYEAAGPGSIPEPITLEPALAGQASKVRFSDDQSVMVTVVDARRDEIEGLGNEDFVFSGAAIWAPDEKYMLFPSNPKLLMRRGAYYVPVAGFPIVTNVTGGTISDDAAAVMLRFTTGPAKIYTKTGTGESATWSEAASVTVDVSVTSVNLTPDGEYIWSLTGTGAGSVLHLNPTTHVYDQVGLATAGWFLRSFQKVSPTEYVASYVQSSSRTTIAFYKFTAGVRAAAGSQTTPTVGYLIDGVQAARDVAEMVVIWTNASTGATLAVLHWNGTTFALGQTITNTGTGAAVNATFCVISADGRQISFRALTTNGVRLYKTTTPSLPFTFTLANTYLSGNSWPYLFSPDGTTLHVATASNDSHWSTVSPYAAKTLTGLTGTNKNSISYSPSGEVIVSSAGTDGPQAAIKSGSGAYLNYATLEGTFVSLWDRDDDKFVERSFVQHPIDSVISDIVISKANYSMLYHLAGSGRLIYNINEENFLLKATKFVANDVSSLAAVSPFETHFVVVYRNSLLATVIRLYEFDGTFEVVERDNKPVDYGPPSFSACATILVAHGGVQPYSLFDHDDAAELLIPEVVVVTDWDEESDILLAKFSADCSGVLIVTPDKVITIKDGTVTDTDNIPTETEDPYTVNDPTSGGSTVVTPPVGGGGDGSGGDNGGPWTYSPGGVLDNISYIPYVSISVTFRTWP